MQITVRLAAPHDAQSLASYNRAMARETEDMDLDPRVVGAGVQGVFDDPSRGFYVVAEETDRMIGALMVTYEWSDWRNGVFLWIQSVYVEPGHRGQGVYRRLYDFVREHARARGDVCGFRLYVDADNARAQQVYAALGMRGSNYLLYEEAADHDAR